MKPVALLRSINIIAALFIGLFVYTATSKLLSHRIFFVTLSESPLLGPVSGFVSWTIPAMELVISALLFIPFYRRTGFRASLILVMAFTLYIGYMLVSSSHLPCSCGGIISKLSWVQHLWLNVFLMALAAWALYLSNRLKSLLQ